MRLGNIVESAGLTRPNLMKGLQLGLGVAAFPFVYGLLQSKVLLKASPAMFAQGTWQEKATRALGGIIAGSLTIVLAKRFGGYNAEMLGAGMMGAGIGSVLNDLAAAQLNPAAAAVQSTVTAAEMSTGEAQVSGMSPMAGGLAGLGALGALGALSADNGDNSMLFGAGTPDMRAAGMFHGATVAIEQNGFAGATVAIEQNNAFAGALT